MNIVRLPYYAIQELNDLIHSVDGTLVELEVNGIGYAAKMVGDDMVEITTWD